MDKLGLLLLFKGIAVHDGRAAYRGDDKHIAVGR